MKNIKFNWPPDISRSPDPMAITGETMKERAECLVVIVKNIMTEKPAIVSNPEYILRSEIDVHRLAAVMLASNGYYMPEELLTDNSEILSQEDLSPAC